MRKFINAGIAATLIKPAAKNKLGCTRNLLKED